ncbi:MAG TPA: hypothetical protein VGQ81_07280, partial [Acidobacteriota bacterium]|nr:hypothetical protein [Acidobacteriota bacterium]
RAALVVDPIVVRRRSSSQPELSVRISATPCQSPLEAGFNAATRRKRGEASPSTAKLRLAQPLFGWAEE